MGTGLGLSICKNILQQHNSAIEMRSRPGETVFEFTLPAAEPAPRIAGDAEGSRPRLPA